MSTPLLLAQAACGGGPEQPTILSGQVAGWPEGSGFIRVTGEPPLATGTVDASGAFSLQLPGRDVMAPRLAPVAEGGDCSVPQATPASLRWGSLSFEVGKAGLGVLPLYRGTYPPSGPSLVGWVGILYLYASAAGKVDGSRVCPGGADIATDYALDLREGWNAVVSTVREHTTAPALHLRYQQRMGPEPPYVQWIMVGSFP